MTNGGGLAALALDAAGRVLAPAYARRVAAHEAGHFLTAYMSGLLPRGYDLSAAAALAARGALNVQAGTRLCDAAFRAEVSSGRLSSSRREGGGGWVERGVGGRGRGWASWARLGGEGGWVAAQGAEAWHGGGLPFRPQPSPQITIPPTPQPAPPTHRSLDAAACVALAGVAAEYLLFGSAEGGLDDVRQLDGLLGALGFTQKKADSQAGMGGGLATLERAGCWGHAHHPRPVPAAATPSHPPPRCGGPC